MTDKIQTIITAKDQASGVFKNFTGNIVAMNQGLELANKALRGLSAPFKAIVGTGMEFTQQMATVRSISKITAQDFRKLSDEAERIGATTAHTSAQAGRAMEELRRAGQNTNKVLDTTASVMDLVSAQGSDMAQTAKLTAIQMNQFADTGLTARKAVDLMNQTLSSSPMNFEQLDYALQAASGTASAAGWNFEQMTAVLGAMAEKGVAGQKAGMALNAAMARLMNPTAEAQKALNKYGIALADVNPATNEFADVVDVLNKKNVTQADLFKILGQLQAPKFFKVIQAGGDSIRNFADKQKEANTAMASAKERMDSLTGDVTLFQSGLDGLKIAVFKSMDAALRGFTQSATAAVQAITAFVQENEGPLTSAFGSMKKALGYVLIGLGSMLQAFGSLLKMEGVQIFLKAIADSAGLVWGAIFKFVDVVQEYIKTSPKMQTTLKLLGDGFDTLFKVAGKVWGITGKLIFKMINLASKAFGPLADEILPVVNMLLKLGNFIADVLLAALNKLDKALDMPILKTLSGGIEKAYGSLKDLGKGFKLVAGPAGQMVMVMDKATQAGKDLEDQLVTHSTVPALKALSEVSVVAGKEAVALGKSLLITTSDAKKLEEQANKAGKAITNITGGGGVDIGFGSGGMIDLNGIKNSIVSGFKEGAPKALKVIAGVGAIVYNAMSSAAAVISGAFGRNKAFQDAMAKITDVIDDSLAPLIEEFIPVVKIVANTLKKVLGPVVKALQPIIQQLADSLGKFLPQLMQAIMPIIKEIIGRILPVFVELIEEIMPVIIELLDALLPIIKGIMDILVPILRELTPLIKAILEIVIELLPILELIIEIIKPFIPIIIVLVRIVTFVVQIIKGLIDALKVVGQFIYDGIKNGLIAGAVIALAPLLLIMKALEAVFNLIKAPLDTISAILTPIKSALDAVADALNIGGGGGGGGWSLTNPTGRGSVTGIPGSPIHSGGFVDASNNFRLPGMSPNEGLSLLEKGEYVVSKEDVARGTGITLNFNITSLDPKESAEEIRQVIEELSLTGRLKLA